MFKKLVGVSVSAILAASLFAGAALSAIAAKTPEYAKQTATEEAAETAESDYTAYLFVHFVEEEKTADHEQIYFSVSENGTEWTTLNNQKPVLKSNVGERGVRDPHIVRTQDGQFVIVATDLSIFNRGGDWGQAQTGGSRNIIVWKGNSLTEMGEGRAVEIGTPDALDVWAPESVWDVDKEQYMVTWASIIGDRASKTCDDWHYRIYRSYTSDFEHFSEPEVYMEREGNIIDTTFYYNEANKMYYRFTKDEHNKWVFMEQGAHLDGDFEMVSTYSLNGLHYSETTGVEGPTVYKSNTEDKWFLLLDNWTYKPYETDDITKGVFTTAGEFQFNGPRFRHGSVLPITKAEYDALLEKYPNPAPATPDKTEGQLIYELDFESGSTAPKTGSYKVTENGTFTYETGATAGSKAAKFANNAFMQIESGLFAGRENMTLSFIVNFTAVGTSWVCFAAPNSNQMNDPPTYIGNFFKDGNVFASERFLGGRFDDSYDNTIGINRWLYVTVVYYKQSTKLFLNGQLASGRPTTASNASLLDILGETPSIFLGKATWGSGEFSKMLLDSFRVYDYAMPDDKVAELYRSDTASTL